MNKKKREEQMYWGENYDSLIFNDFNEIIFRFKEKLSNGVSK